MSHIVYYSWVPFFKAICAEIATRAKDAATRDYELYLKAKDTFQPDHAILQVQFVDPFSYIYALAQRSTKNQRTNTFTKVKNAFSIPLDLPSDWIFPTPTPNSKSLFYTKGQYIANDGTEVGSKVIWDLFDEVFNNKEVTHGNFSKVLSLKNVGVTKLTQVLFLVNPEKYIPFETQMNSLPIPELSNLKESVSIIESEGFPAYKKAIEDLNKVFPACNMYEVNLLNVLLNETNENQLRISNKYCQVSSWAEGQQATDYFEDFVKHNGVWTGGATSESGLTEYPLQDFKKGDVVLVRKGTKNLGGIGIVIENEYQPHGWNEDAMIKIVWLNKKTGWTDDALGQRVGFARATDKTINAFRDSYPETFAFLQSVQHKQKVMANHALNKYKNIILQGPPGTGKTRLAKQIALWLTDENPKELSLMDAIDKNIFDGEPSIEGIDEIELIQFHPSYSYEDFVRGITTATEGEKLIYKVENKVLATIAAEAAKEENQGKAYVLIIDEINRANLPSVLGELIYALEYRGKEVATMYTFGESSKITLPHNLYIIGTMNTADRSVGHIDYAIRRRFSFVAVLPNEAVIIHPKAKALFNKVQNLFENYTAPDFNKKDVAIGHSYFLYDDSEIALKLKYDIKPILTEYVNDGILTEAAKPEIENLSV